MDPLSVAGLGLGAISLAFQLFAGCIKGFVLLSTAQHIGKESSTLVCMLNLQEIQLTEWARRAGLLPAPHELDRRLNAAIVQAVLKELESLLLDTENLKSRYRLGFQAASFSGTANHPPVSPAGGVLDVAISDDTRRDVLFRAGLIQNRNTLPQRLRWATIDKSKFEDYIDRIRMFVQDLWRLLDPLRQDEMASGLQQVLSHVIGMSQKFEELNALKDTLEHASIISGSSSSETPNAPLASAAEIKAFTMGLGDAVGHVPSAAASHIPNFRPHKAAFQLISTEIHDFIEIKGNHDMGIAKYEGEIVFIEWKELPVHSRSKIMGRVQDLAFLLGAPKHPEFRALRCKGTALDTGASRIAYVFEMPVSSALKPPVSLRASFGSNPSVTDRLQLALRITESVRYFHMAGWLHKNLRSENIIFFPPFSLACPTLAGFNFCRPDSPSEISEQPSADPERDIYRHPEAMGEPMESFSVAKDVYALGTILLEVGEWRSLKSLVEKVADLRRSDIAPVHLAKINPFLVDETAQGGLATLRFRMGDIYAAVTRMMLNGEIPGIFAFSKDEGQIFAPNMLDVAIISTVSISWHHVSQRRPRLFRVIIASVIIDSTAFLSYLCLRGVVIMVGRKIVQDSDDESNWGNSPPPADHESHDPSLDTSVDLPSSSSRMIIEQSEQPSTSSTERLNRDLRDAHNNLLEPTPKSIPSVDRFRHSSEQPSPSSQTKSPKRRATLGISQHREKKVKRYGRTSREGGDFYYGHSEDELGGTSLSQKPDKHRILHEEVQDNHTPLEDSAAASRVNSMLNDYRGSEISILSSGGIGKHFSLETSVQRIALPSVSTVSRNIATQQSESSTWPTIPNVTPAQSSSSGRAATHSSNADIANTGDHDEATLNGQTTSEANGSGGSNKTTSLSRDSTGSAIIRDQAAPLPVHSSKRSRPQAFEEQKTNNSTAADELGSDDPSIGLPKDQYQPRPSRSRGNQQENDLLIPESFSKRPEALVKEKRRAKNRRKTTALERPTPKIEVEDEDEEEVKVPLVAIPRLPPRPRDRYPYNDETDREKFPEKGPGQATAVNHYSENNNDDESRAKQGPKESKEVAPGSPSSKKRGRGRPKKQTIPSAGDTQDFESGDEAGHEPNEGFTKPGLAQKRKARTDHACAEDEHGEGSAEEQETHQDTSNGNEDPMSAPSDNEPDTDLPPTTHEPISAQPKPRGRNKRKLDDNNNNGNEPAPHPSDHDDTTATDTAQPLKAPPKKRGRKKKSDQQQPAPSFPPTTDQETILSEQHLDDDDEPEQNPHAAPLKALSHIAPAGSSATIATPPTTPPKVARPVHSPITSSTVKFRVGLSKKARIAPLLRVVRK